MESNPSPKKRPARSAPTRAALVAAGFELLVERPIDAIPIDEVVKRAGVAKGSFFNHFRDKQDFASAIGVEVRVELEQLVSRANAPLSDPVERIANGLRVAAEFALAQPKRTAVLLRSQGSSTARDHPLTRGLREDIEAACAEGQLRPEALSSGVLYWLGLCQVVMATLVAQGQTRDKRPALVREMLVLGLSGLGVAPERAAVIAASREKRPTAGTAATRRQ